MLGFLPLVLQAQQHRPAKVIESVLDAGGRVDGRRPDVVGWVGVENSAFMCRIHQLGETQPFGATINAGFQQQLGCRVDFFDEDFRSDLVVMLRGEHVHRDQESILE